MPGLHRACPKCGHQPLEALPADAQCPACGVYFQKWAATQAARESGEALPASASRRPAAVVPARWQRALDTLLTPLPALSPPAFYGRCAALALLAVWGLRLIALDYRSGETGGSFMHAILLPIHEAGHVFLIPFGQFMTILGGSLFQLALPLAIGVAFKLNNRDHFGAALCLWWTGASLLDLAPYIYDALQPQLILLGGHTGEDGPHDWIYLLDSVGQRQHAQGWGFVAHQLGAATLLVASGWAAAVLWRQRRQVDETGLT